MVGTSTLTLAADGIFPIVKDAEGRPLSRCPASGFSFPGTVQGEGKLNGIPSLFIRLAGCNLHCCWKRADGTYSLCDTVYASYAIRESVKISVSEAYRVIRQNTERLRHVVITGGEPFLQTLPLAELSRMLKTDGYHLTVETNATLYDETLVRSLDFFSMSPKLSNSTPPGQQAEHHGKYRINVPVISAFIRHARQYKKDFQLKFVYSSEKDLEEIETLLSRLEGWKNEDILLMPLGGTVAELKENSRKTLEQCIRKGWRYCDRLHLSLFGNQPGV